MHKDTLQRFIFEKTPIRGSVVNLNSTLQLALNKQHLPIGLKRALGELMAASALLTATLKMNGSLVLQIQSQGSLKLLVVECNSEFGIRATAKWAGDIQDTETLFDLLAQGQFMITLDPKDGGQTYQGIVALEGTSIATILENYMLRSEQIDTKIWLCCDGNIAAGMLLQKLPDTMNQTIHEHDIDTWNRVGHLADTITDDELLQLPTETLLHRLFHEEDVRLFEASHTKFQCSCSRKNVAGMLRMLGADELKSILEEQGKIDINCDFCGAHYQFDAVDATQLFTSEITSQLSKEVH
ncbi:MAG: Hsp33 family molecular chaperone HslO [Betaproteobacteria bacterium HGW-Betaproteobacteria-22]|nr:MAG: Hsp33 family molecular chaperone HslO [Betaproteobacteria bacterium HGW-Betaproteobacteria-22]